MTQCDFCSFPKPLLCVSDTICVCSVRWNNNNNVSKTEWHPKKKKKEKNKSLKNNFFIDVTYAIPSNGRSISKNTHAHTVQADLSCSVLHIYLRVQAWIYWNWLCESSQGIEFKLWLIYSAVTLIDLFARVRIRIFFFVCDWNKWYIYICVFFYLPLWWCIGMSRFPGPGANV